MGRSAVLWLDFRSDSREKKTDVEVSKPVMKVLVRGKDHPSRFGCEVALDYNDVNYVARSRVICVCLPHFVRTRTE